MWLTVLLPGGANGQDHRQGTIKSSLGSTLSKRSQMGSTKALTYSVDAKTLSIW